MDGVVDGGRGRLMLAPTLWNLDRPPVVLLLGAHCDDIEIGCGGTVLELVERHPGLRVHWTVFASDPERCREARVSAEAFLSGTAEAEVEVMSFRENHFPWLGSELKDAMEAVRSRVRPDLVLTHSRADAHQDHRTVAELTHNAFREHLVLEYEIPKYDGDLGPTNVYVPMPRERVEEKARLLVQNFPSQRARPWFDPETFLGLARLRGVESGAAVGYAEAFRCSKLRLDLGRTGERS